MFDILWNFTFDKGDVKVGYRSRDNSLSPLYRPTIHSILYCSQCTLYIVHAMECICLLKNFMILIVFVKVCKSENGVTAVPVKGVQPGSWPLVTI